MSYMTCVCSAVTNSLDPMGCDPPGPLSMGFFWQKSWSGLPFPPPEDLPDSRIEPVSPGPPALAGRCFTTEPLGENYTMRERLAL